MASPLWYKLSETKQRLESLRHSNQVLGHDIDEIISALRTILSTVHDLDNPYKALTTPIARAIELEPVPKQADPPTPTGDPHCPPHSGKN